MKLPLVNVSTCELCSVIRFFTAKYENAINIHRNLVSLYDEGCMSIQMVLRWRSWFLEGRQNVHDDERSGRPVTATDNAAVAAVRNVVEADRRVTIDEIVIRLPPGIEIGRSSIGTIMSDVLNFPKVCARWTLRLLSDNHKQQYMKATRAFLEMHRKDGDQLFSRIVTGDESWVHHSTPETKRQSMVWKKPEESAPKRRRYCEVLTKLRAAIKRKRPGLLSRNVLLVHDNARPHAARTTQTLLENFKWEIFTHPPYSPDLSPSDFHLFPALKLHLGGKHFANDDEVQAEANHWLRGQGTAWYNSGIKKLLQRRMEKKRKIDSECRKFKDQWNIQYFVIESSNKALCLICNESIAVLKEYNMKRHYETKHSQNYSKYTGIVRTEKFEALKRGLKSQQSLFTKVKTEQEAATRASFRVALEIAKRGKPFTDGEMIKECIIAVVEEMCPEKVNLLKTVSMSANTVARRVENIAENISSQLFDKNGNVEWFSLALDESTDVSDTAQVLIYIRGVDKSYEVHEELLDMYSIHGTTTGTDIFKGVEMAINKKNLRWKNLKCITTDGGKNMSGKDKGVVALVSKAVENDGGSKPLVLHCIIHQQSLCGKCLDMSDVLKPVISTVNFIRSFGLNHRQFRQFIAEIGETDLPYHTAVRWLSCGKVLQRFFELRAVIEIFLNEKHRPLTELQNNAWLWKLAFYVDLTKHVNELNLRLQGENQHLPDLYTNIKSFRMKLILFQSQLRSKCFSHFKTCEIFSHTTETEFPIDFAIENLSALKINFDTRFSDFDAIANQIKIFQNPFDADIETLAPELQMEMIDLQCSDIIKNKYENSSLLEFYKSLPLTQFDNLHKFARGLFSVFGTTYLCEKTFSKMKYTKNVYRSKLTDEHLKSLLIIGTSKISPQLQTIVGGKSQLHTSH
ncbi:EPM2AIP1 [Cordylochernes scorpioides]|uniref:EPM2AIP1 n=1 Tax=Cordylochernes scorpioides TaxID=51811 RepID=A0ABY6KYT8_9ARAC|nr:EPM2AIP1 [Cordylochernes scorpioides]